MKISDVKVGQCYRTEGNWIRYVENIDDGKVRYRSRGGQFKSGWTSADSFQFQKLQMFAFDVIETVPENWEPQSSQQAV